MITVVNLESKQQVVLGVVGNVELDIPAKTVTYQELVSTKEYAPECEDGGGWYCEENSMRTIMVPGGEVLQKQLP